MTILVLDDIDEQIVRELSENGRTSNRDIARRLGLSEGAIRKRLRRLDQAKAIRYGLLVDLPVAGVYAAIWIKIMVDPNEVLNVSERVAGLCGCSLCCVTSGEYHIFAYLLAHDDEGLRFDVASIMKMSGVRIVRVSEVVSHPVHRYQNIFLPG